MKFKDERDALRREAPTVVVPPVQAYTLPQELVQAGAMLFVSKGATAVSFFDLLIVCDSFGMTKTSTRGQGKWYMQEAADSISRALDLSVCVISCRGASFGSATKYADLLQSAPPASTLLLQYAGNDFLAKKDWTHDVVRLRMILPSLAFSRCLAVVGGSAATWQYNDNGFDGKRDLCMQLLSTSAQCISGRDELLGISLADAIGHCHSSSKPQLIAAWQKWADVACALPQRMPVVVHEPRTSTKRVVRRFARQVRCVIAKKQRLSEVASDVVCCVNCLTWTTTRGYAQHLDSCLPTKCGAKYRNRCLSFAVAQVAHLTEAWKVYMKEYSTIPIFVAATCPKHETKMIVWAISRE